MKKETQKDETRDWREEFDKLFYQKKQNLDV